MSIEILTSAALGLAKPTMATEVMRQTGNLMATYAGGFCTPTRWLLLIRLFQQTTICGGELSSSDSLKTYHVSAYVEERLQSQAKASVKQELAAIRMLYDWLIISGVVPELGGVNPAASVRGPKLEGLSVQAAPQKDDSAGHLEIGGHTVWLGSSRNQVIDKLSADLVLENSGSQVSGADLWWFLSEMYAT